MLNIILSGAPGAGKGTQAVKLAQALNLKHLSTGSLLRQEVSDNSQIGQKVAQIMAKGDLVPDEIVDQIIAEQIEKDGSGFIFDGYPRNKEQMENLDFLLKEKRLPWLIDLKVPKEELMSRLLARAEKDGRADDNEETINRRMEIYQREHRPVLEFYQEEQRYLEINGEGSEEDVYKRLLETIEKIK